MAGAAKSVVTSVLQKNWASVIGIYANAVLRRVSAKRRGSANAVLRALAKKYIYIYFFFRRRVADFIIWRLSRLTAARLLARMGLNAVHMSSSKGLDLNLLVHFCIVVVLRLLTSLFGSTQASTCASNVGPSAKPKVDKCCSNDCAAETESPCLKESTNIQGSRTPSPASACCSDC
jgi:hypothetical protein